MWASVKGLAPFGKGLLGAVIGGLLFLLVIHVIIDHQQIHAMIKLWNDNQAKIDALPGK